ncbi:MAG: ribonuclease III [Candidatus Phosphoribacter sp.]|nr:ribonuclease III [Actinomycetales bacterium]
MGLPGGSPEPSLSTVSDYLAEVIGQSVDEGVLTRALTHRSYAYEHGGLPNNERLEFLGDSVLGLVITDTLYAVHPDLAEGNLAKLRASVVNMRALADVARTIDLGAHVRLGRGEEATGGRNKASILADTLEALIGTVYLAGGLPVAARFVHHLFDPLLAAAAGLGAGLDWKTSLQEICSEFGNGSPDYHLEESGPDHEKVFHATVTVAQESLGTGRGHSKKEAEQAAAEQAWGQLSARKELLMAETAGPPDSPDPDRVDCVG